ncbi:Tim44/TimA family putative adaptor protein [Paracoccus pacificus]|uniref:Tim44/TimA family putative adaptor protein n=1 Tax=Paracoccus pacificus TaxID=1463598 RepID=A0ABW4R757_9RHOB
MTNAVVQLLVLAAIAVFLIIRLRNVLGTRDGFEAPRIPTENEPPARVGGPADDGRASAGDQDISDHAPAGSPTEKALRDMKAIEPAFSVNDFLNGAKGAYEMILTSFEKGDISQVRAFLAPPVADAFDGVIAGRNERGETVEAQFLGVRETALQGAEFDPATGEAQLAVRFVGEMISTTRDANGNVIEGDGKTAQKQRDLWTFARRMGQADPNWQLVATGY